MGFMIYARSKLEIWHYGGMRFSSKRFTHSTPTLWDLRTQSTTAETTGRHPTNASRAAFALRELLRCV